MPTTTGEGRGPRGTGRVSYFCTKSERENQMLFVLQIRFKPWPRGRAGLHDGQERGVQGSPGGEAAEEEGRGRQPQA